MRCEYVTFVQKEGDTGIKDERMSKDMLHYEQVIHMSRYW